MSLLEIPFQPYFQNLFNSPAIIALSFLDDFVILVMSRLGWNFPWLRRISFVLLGYTVVRWTFVICFKALG